ncbi:MAG: tetratricopeptide repeat protein [Clostridia bacterium]|nr:tetratricopeptide repeat protein [Clostridia bacterium]
MKDENKPFLKPEDYTEPACPFCDPTDRFPRRIPVGRVLSKLDGYVAARDTEGALRHLDYWYEEAKENRDEGGMLTVLCEKMGVLRKAELHGAAFAAADEALALVKKTDLGDDPAAGTAYLNAGTVHSAAGDFEGALPLYEEAERIYRAVLKPDDARFAGLYNNKAVVLAALERYGEARSCYHTALTVLENKEDTALDRAVTYTNLANLSEAEKGLEEGEREIEDALNEAQKLLDAPTVKSDAYAAFVFSKCAPVFAYYGRFFYAKELEERSKNIYEGS